MTIHIKTIRMLVLGYVFAIRSERALCRDVQVNFAYRWFCGLPIEAITCEVLMLAKVVAGRRALYARRIDDVFAVGSS